jgi:hypothetical protein
MPCRGCLKVRAVIRKVIGKPVHPTQPIPGLTPVYIGHRPDICQKCCRGFRDESNGWWCCGNASTTSSGQ